MLEGRLVDLVPYGDRYLEREYDWHNGDAWFWATAGDRMVVSRGAGKRHQQEHAARRAEHPRPSVMFGIQTKDGKPIGDIALALVWPQHRLAMLGAGIGEPGYTGGGYGTDALLLCVEYAFRWLDFHKLWLGTMSLNARVLRQMEKVGFHQEGARREAWLADGVYYDDVIFAVLNEEWPGYEVMFERAGLANKLKGK